MYAVDEDLIFRVRNKATGATVHDVENAVGYYRSCATLCNRYGEKNHPKHSRLSHWEECLDIARRRLRILANTGKLVSLDEVRKRAANTKELL